MKILCYIHTFNDKDDIDLILQSLSEQTCPVKDILVVDNGSTDGTFEMLSTKPLTLIRNLENLGVSNAVAKGFQYALDKGYELIWILDADSIPKSDALEKLVDLYRSFDAEARSRIGVISSTHLLEPSMKLFQGRRLTPGGPRLPRIDPDLPYLECDSTIWSGSLFTLQAVREAGFPRFGKTGYWEDLSLDYGDVEFFYRIKKSSFRVIVHRFSIITHTIGQSKEITRIFGRPFVDTRHSSFRRYIFFRNMVYFWLYIYPRKNWVTLFVWFLYRFSVTILGILVTQEKPASKIRACFRGIWDGLHKNLCHNYNV